MAVDEAPERKRTPLVDDYHLLTYQQLDSTNDEARRLAEGGGAHGAFIWSHAQVEGRGRRGNDWISQQGNLFVSALLTPECPLEIFPQLSFVAAAAAHASVAPVLPEASLKLKWPNDIMLNDAKLAGILLESFETISDEGEHKRWAVVGLGMNIENAPKNLEYPAISLREAGVELISAKIVLSRFIHHFVEWYELWQDDGFDPVRRYWLNHAMHKDEPMQVLTGDEFYMGTYAGMDEVGNLLLTESDGESKTITAGEVLL